LKKKPGGSGLSRFPVEPAAATVHSNIVGVLEQAQKNGEIDGFFLVLCSPRGEDSRTWQSFEYELPSDVGLCDTTLGLVTRAARSFGEAIDAATGEE